MPQSDPPPAETSAYYCAECRLPVARPLVCRDCASIICRECGAPLERVDDLGIG